MTTYLTKQNQTLETNQLTNQTQNVINLNAPQTSQPNLLPNINNSPQYNPQNNQNINSNIVVNQNIIVNQDKKPTNITVKTIRTLTGRPVKVGLEPERMECPFCQEKIETQTKRSTNIKALLTAIGTLYIGFYLIQTCKGKPVSFDDCEHSCPKCGNIIGTYYAV